MKKNDRLARLDFGWVWKEEETEGPHHQSGILPSAHALSNCHTDHRRRLEPVAGVLLLVARIGKGPPMETKLDSSMSLAGLVQRAR